MTQFNLIAQEFECQDCGNHVVVPIRYVGMNIQIDAPHCMRCHLRKKDGWKSVFQ